MDPNIKNELLQAEELLDNNFLSDPPKGRIPEYIFVQYFLPYFIKREKLTDKVVNEWVSIAGGITRAVDILSKTNEVLYTVPPLIDPDKVSVTEEGGVSIYDMLATAEVMNERIPFSGKCIIDKTKEKVHTDARDHESVWKDIYIRYGLIKEEDAQKPQDDEDDFLEY